MATAPLAMTRRAASSVTTVPPVTTSDTARGVCAPAGAIASAANTAAASAVDRMRQIVGDSAPAATSRAAWYNTSHAPVVHLVTHPLVHDALATLRDVDTPPDIFRRVAERITLLLAADVAQGRQHRVRHRADAARSGLRPPRRRRRDVVPVLRAGLGMIEGVLELLPSARVGHIGLQRDEATAMAVEYYVGCRRRSEDDSSC